MMIAITVGIVAQSYFGSIIEKSTTSSLEAFGANYLSPIPHLYLRVFTLYQKATAGSIVHIAYSKFSFSYSGKRHGQKETLHVAILLKESPVSTSPLIT